jgi:tRNA threonylcarbamoyladenosine biosynthesis protein TsaB
MIVLALETATDRLSVALVDSTSSPGREAARSFDGARMHAAKLFPLVEEVLAELGGTLDRVDALAVADGPGSFTGLRVGAAAVKALARACPRVTGWTASTLLVRAVGSRSPRRGQILVVTSALRGELYAASYRLDLPHAIETVSPPALATPESLTRETPDLLVADAPDRVLDRLADQFAVPLVRGALALPSATALAGLIGVSGGAEPISDLDAWEPRYGRPAEAQIRWELAHGHSLPDPARRAR